MAKKRKTREEKTRARLRQEASARQAAQREIGTPTFSFVKGEFDKVQIGSSSQAQNLKRARTLGQSEILASSPRDLLKTFIIATLILAAEVVLYFAWKS